MTDKFKPLLAATLENDKLDNLTFPVLCTPKLDGCRIVIKDGVVYSRTMKPIRSEAVQRIFGKSEYNGLDGELIYGDPTAEDVFNKTTSFVMSKNIPEGMVEGQIKFFAFDYYPSERGYVDRLEMLKGLCGKVFPLYPVRVNNVDELLAFESDALEEGFEGIMIRSMIGKYKQGRSTLKEGILLKLKRFSDSEAQIIGFEEKMHNTNAKEEDERGYAKRSSAKAGLMGVNTLGALVVRDLKTGVEFNIGSGYDDALRQEIWNNKSEWMGKIITYKFFDVQSGGYIKPRFPTYKGVRDMEDIVKD